jgi:hypothetical protein
VLLRLFGMRVRRTPRGYVIKAAVWAAVGGLWVAAGDRWPAVVWFVVAGGYGAVGALVMSAERVGRPAWYVDHQVRVDFRRMLSWHPDIAVDKQGIRLAYDDGSAAVLGWDEVREVVLISLKRPLAGTDVFLLFKGQGDKALPILYDELPLNWLEEIHRLPGFDTDSPSRARLRSHGSQQFVCWRRVMTAGEPNAVTV